MSISLWSHRVHSPLNSPGQNTGVGSCFLLQRIFPTQGLNPGLPHCTWNLYQLSHQGSPRILDWVAISSSRESPWPRDQTSISYVSCIAGEFFTTELLGQLRRLSKFKPWWEVGDPAAFTHVGTVSWENCLFFSRYFSSHFALYSLCPLCQDTREENRWAVVSRAKIKLMHHIHYCMHFFSWRECDFLFMSCFLGNWRLQNPLTLS